MPTYKYKYIHKHTDAVLYVLSGRKTSSDKILGLIVKNSRDWGIENEKGKKI